MAKVAARQQELRQTCATLVPQDGPTVLEIGCGHGHFLAAYAAAHPDTFCLGIDLVTKRVEKGRSKAEKRGLEHVHFLKAEVQEFLECLPEETRFNRIFMLFPDPWPKKRHHKNRMIQPALLDLLRQRITPEGAFYFRTDHEGYFDWTVEHIANHPEWQLRDDMEWPFEQSSFFQELMDSWQSLIATPT